MSTGPHQHPSISVALAIIPSHFSSDIPHPNPTITLTAISDYPKPITIFTYNTIFHLDLSLYRSDFTCQDTTGTDTPRSMNIDVSKGPRRPAFSRESGGPDDEYFVTLEPNTPFEFEHAFWLVDGEEAPNTFLPGHRYLLGAKEGAQVRWWQTGRKDDVIAPPGTKSLLGSAAGEPILLNVGRVEFECV